MWVIYCHALFVTINCLSRLAILLTIGSFFKPYISIVKCLKFFFFEKFLFVFFNFTVHLLQILVRIFFSNHIDIPIFYIKKCLLLGVLRFPKQHLLKLGGELILNYLFTFFWSLRLWVDQFFNRKFVIYWAVLNASIFLYAY